VSFVAAHAVVHEGKTVEQLRDWTAAGGYAQINLLALAEVRGLTPAVSYQFNFIANWNCRGS